MRCRKHVAGAGLMGMVMTLAFLAIAASAWAKPRAEAGLPLLRAFSPAQYQADAQNWTVVQAPDGILYVGNNRGVLSFDGQRWRLTPVANGSVVRSLAVDASGRVYVGANGELGYLAPDGDGELRYVSLIDRLPQEARDFTDVWNTLATGDGVVFSSPQRLMRWRNERFELWHPKERFGVAFGDAQGVFVVDSGLGIRQLHRESWRLLPGSEPAGRARQVGLVPLPGGSASRPVLLVASPSFGFMRYAEDRLAPWPTEIDEALSKNDLMVKSLQPLGDDSLLVGTLSGGLYVMDQDGHLLVRMGESEGLPDVGVAASAVDREGGLWLALGNGLARLSLPNPLSRLDERRNAKHMVTAMHRHGGALHVGTTQGAFRLGATAPHGLQPLPAQDKQTRALLPTEQALLAAGAPGVHAIQGDRSEHVLAAYAGTALLAPRSRPDWVLVGLVQGLALLRLDGERWRDAGLVPGLQDEVRTLVEDDAGRVWVGTYNTGLLRVDLSGLGDDGTVGALPVERFGLDDGLPSINYNLVFPVGGQPAFATSAGIYRFDEATRRFGPDPRYAGLFERPRTVYVLHDDPANGLWAYTEDPATGLKETGLVRTLADGTRQWDPRPLRAFTGQETFAIHADGDGVAWFGVGDGLFRYDGRIPKDYAQPFDTLLRKVSGAQGRLLDGGHGPAPAVALPYAANSLRFEYAAPSFEGEDAIRFQVKLEGSDTGWSDWSAEDYKDYNNLFEGEYVFRVRAKNLYDTVGTEASYRFTVLPPWYRTAWAYLGYALALGLAGWGLLRWRLSRVLAQKAALETTVAERTRQLAEQAEALRAANQQLLALDGFKQGMMGMIVHDLKNPLGVILHAVDSPSLASRVAQVRQSARQMLTMVLNILDVQKFEDTRVVLDAQPVPLATLVAGAVEQVRFLIERKNLALALAVPEGLAVRGDAEMLERVLVNLLTNAVKFTPPNGRLAVRADTEDDGQVRLQVQDSGDGVPADQRERVFARFGQLHARDSGGARSTGLGLTFCKLAVEAHGGAIGVTDAPGGGAAFWFTLPRADAGGAPISAAAVDVPSAGLEGPALDDADRAALAPFVALLRPIPIYRYSALLAVLDRPDFPTNPRIDAWRARVALAIETENDALLAALLAP
jgi:signal transduction histidine kinase